MVPRLVEDRITRSDMPGKLTASSAMIYGDRPTGTPHHLPHQVARGEGRMAANAISQSK
jgi:hypothetical protein